MLVLTALAAMEILMPAPFVSPAAPTASEIAEARRWARAKFEGIVEAPAPAPGLVVYANNDVVQKNARAGRPMNIAGQPYTRGLYCHAVSKVLVRLPAPGRAFRAVAGVDTNDQTSGGRGSVVFAVRVGAVEAYNSGLMREGMAGRPAEVDLAGAEEFWLEVGDAGDGIACDQADWADARATLRDGREVWLADLPMRDTLPAAYTVEPPFAFMYDGKASRDLLAAWPLQRETRALDAGRLQHTLTWTEPGDRLVVRCTAVEYRDYPTVEWTVTFRNAGRAAAPLLEDVQAIDTTFGRGASGEFALHHQVGTLVAANDYEPKETTLGPGADLRLASRGGRPCGGVFPYFSVEWPGQGVIAVVGWPGQWAADFARDDAGGLRLRAGQEKVRLALRPGEGIRTPLMALQFWQGDRIHAQNVWRRWMVAHNLPRPGGKPPPPQMTPCSSHQFGEMIHANEENQKLFIDRYLEEGIRPDYWWMDAGWYVNKTGWPNTGTWEVDTTRFPHGLRAISDHAHAKGVKTLVWFEPERVTPGTWLYEQHPEWLIGPDGGQKLLNLGDPAARRWLTDHIDRLLTEQGIDLYRQDYNVDPLEYWRANDAPDRQGATENHYVQGYLAYWDELRRRHPDMLIDSCASGGHRNDLETMRRAVPLLRSDWIQDPVGNQGHTYGLAFWLPYYGTGTDQTGVYELRSAMSGPGFIPCWDMRRKDLPYAQLRRLAEQWRSYAGCYLGDYYPLTPYSLDGASWIAWQFDRPEAGDGLVQAFRRNDSVYESARFRLGGLDPSARYEVRDLQGGPARRTSGRELMEDGLLVEMTTRPDAVVLTYRRL